MESSWEPDGSDDEEANEESCFSEKATGQDSEATVDCARELAAHCTAGLVAMVQCEGASAVEVTCDGVAEHAEEGVADGEDADESALEEERVQRPRGASLEGFQGSETCASEKGLQEGVEEEDEEERPGRQEDEEERQEDEEGEGVQEEDQQATGVVHMTAAVEADATSEGEAGPGDAGASKLVPAASEEMPCSAAAACAAEATDTNIHPPEVNSVLKGKKSMKDLSKYTARLRDASCSAKENSLASLQQLAMQDSRAKERIVQEVGMAVLIGLLSSRPQTLQCAAVDLLATLVQGNTEFALLFRVEGGEKALRSLLGAATSSTPSPLFRAARQLEAALESVSAVARASTQSPPQPSSAEAGGRCHTPFPPPYSSRVSTRVWTGPGGGTREGGKPPPTRYNAVARRILVA